MKFVFASSNPNKIKEIRELLPETIELLGLLDIGCTEDIPETATTLEGNAQLKADYVTQNYGLPCFADDSGLEVEALGGAPGVFSARYAGEPKDDRKNIEKLLHALEGNPNREAQFRTVIALNVNGESHLFEGTIKGEILSEQRGDHGFGYDPIFVPKGLNQSFGELSSEEKNKISHRAQAVHSLINFLTELETKF